MNIRLPSRPLTAAAFTLALASSLLACSDDDTSNGGGRDGGSPDAGKLDGGSGGDTDAGGNGEDEDSGEPSEPPLYAVVSVPATAMGAPTTSYVILSENLTSELKTENAALEVEGSAIAAGLPGGKHLFVGTNQSALLKRYDLGSDGKLKETGEVNFQARQVQNFVSYASNFQFVDATHAFYFALSAAKIIPWNPEELTVGAAIDLPEVVRKDPDNAGNYTTSITGSPIRRGDKIYWFIAWDSRNAGVIKMAPAAAAVVLDTKANTAKVVTDEGSCGYTRDGVVSGDWIYLATEAAGTAMHYLNAANGQPPCLRRFNMTTETYDDTFKADLTEIAGSPAGTLVTSPSGEALIYVLDKAAADPMIGPGMNQINNPRVLAVGALWKTARLTVGDNPTIELLDLPLASGSVLPHVLKNDFKVTATFDSAPELREVTDDGVVTTSRASAKLNGNTASIVQIR